MAATDVRHRKGKATAVKKAEDEAVSSSSSSSPSHGRHENRGHRLFRATPSSHTAPTPLLRFLRYTQGVTTAVTAVSILGWNARVESAWYLFGALATSTAAKTLKTMIKDPRPEGSAVKTHGMPSTHSATVSFMTCYVLAYPLVKVVQHRGDVLAALTPWEMCYSAVLATFLPLVMWSRVALGVHSGKQVIIGGCLGLVVANGAWQIWNADTSWGGGRPLRMHEKVEQWDQWITAARLIVIDGLKWVADRVAVV
ncbi:hypothetical protein BDZ90DRAFT_232954 [Jaminaea rosea]|uniref:Phosphatidic acid phosphatase type 2/haloperoxidase domain-containing protein n=1 Tax=Jaminaea rosea TaxID=1569628 RepID=A0A316UPZ2_9BASI|nr:hypothetical protein BDZ90DRAFT_232954 [Jaminaea rosea]PWN26858.1 hypothetical protein BDZ90DRAFT_232954 [Jaminaea rosea]